MHIPCPSRTFVTHSQLWRHRATSYKITKSQHDLSLSLSLSLPGGENWGRSVPSPCLLLACLQLASRKETLEPPPPRTARSQVLGLRGGASLLSPARRQQGKNDPPGATRASHKNVTSLRDHSRVPPYLGHSARALSLSLSPLLSEGPSFSSAAASSACSCDASLDSACAVLSHLSYLHHRGVLLKLPVPLSR